MDSHNNITPLEILKFWHKVEFFAAYDLDDVLDRSRKTGSYLYSEQFGADSNQDLPWLSPMALEFMGGTPLKDYRYNLYLLPFNKGEVIRVSNRIFPLSQNEFARTELEEKFDEEGMTCFARMSVNEFGEPNFATISVSTLPWALGKLAKHKLEEINYQNFQNDLGVLKDSLQLLSRHLANKNSVITPDAEGCQVLTAMGLLKLIEIMRNWAGFSPIDEIVTYVELVQIKKPIQKEKPLLIKSATTEQTPPLQPPAEEKDDSPTAGHEEPIGVLNSFYIEDIEKVTRYLEASHSHEQLQNYVMGTDPKARLDLYSKEGAEHIVKTLSPQHLLAGRWLREPNHNMSLMQQFAVNNLFTQCKAEGIFSVNGPPGTGKTTLLQEIVAENVVQRARRLAQFDQVHKTFIKKQTINFSNRNERRFHVLHEALTGFEMVVVSSNNAAVENVSKELPLRRKLGPDYQATGFLQPIATKLAAEHEIDQITKLPEIDKPWGLISVALGKAKNRNEFLDRVFFKRDSEEQAQRRIAEGEYLSIWEWAKNYKGQSFTEARQQFIKKDNEVKKLQQQLIELETLQQTLIRMQSDNSREKTQQEVNKTQQKINETIAVIEDKQQKLQVLKQEQQEINSNIQQVDAFKPSIAARLMREPAAIEYASQRYLLQTALGQLIKQQLILKQEIKDLEYEQLQLQQRLALLTAEYDHEQATLSERQQQYDQLLQTLGDVTLPPADHQLEHHHVQMTAFWQNARINQLRSELFADALQLHQTWLAEAINSGLFTGNLMAISQLLSNRRPTNPDDELLILQSLFMWVPVVSSTFASVGRQFANIGAQQLGWVLIDEAGQSVPQTAVGAIWRAKRVMVIGDPQQIEPVFTTPANLVEGIAAHYLKCNYGPWLPTTSSVQALADRANPWGASLLQGQQRLWVGCPLRIHRRCDEPMFSIANHIAYDGKMINAQSPTQVAAWAASLGESAWFDIAGDAIDKHYIDEQGQFLLRLFARTYQDHQGLQNIYIISPFRSVRKNIRKLILDMKNWANMVPFSPLPHRVELWRWCRERIGTVHTFQGREEDVVILILGADKAHQGAANWAASKPNLLNVAVTRARQRLYVIGSVELWSRKNYFSVLARYLPVKTHLAMETLTE